VNASWFYRSTTDLTQCSQTPYDQLVGKQ
jgi:hypothetical protein